MADPWDELAASVIEAVKARTKDFLDHNSDAKDFLLERAKRLAKLAYEYAKASDDKRPAIKADMAVVQQTMENEVATVAVNASVEARATFKAVLGTAFEVIIKSLPAIVAII